LALQPHSRFFTRQRPQFQYSQMIHFRWQISRKISPTIATRISVRLTSQASASSACGAMGRSAYLDPSRGWMRAEARGRYLTRLSSLNIGMYIERMITPTIAPTMIIISGSMIDVRD
jgi:hypothetical protein